ncbi:glutathione S-transferase [Novosphingobium hassiacum]|uniref:Glutathione S-transferase n=1 Tax=Novosphingobium hassiacum TaxID=173676 RepID=A0A7W6EXA6_9SPHN|nr:glutathione S-transferase family protein [Novosphingobium hassiacum]MBB3862173.1 glutathione S-transferase [Novosphingobium hassiacum]
MITLHHSPTTRSFRIKWLLEELGVPYHEEVRSFYNMERHDPAYQKVNPIGSFPTFEDDSLVLTESGAIINHILRHHGRGCFRPEANSREEAQVDEWMYWSEGLFAVHQRIFWDHCAPPPGCILDPVPSVGEEARRQAIRYAAMLETALREDGWMVGDTLTGADFMLCFPLFLANLYGWFETLPRIAAYVGRIAARPAFQRAIADTVVCMTEMRKGTPEYPSFRGTETLA